MTYCFYILQGPAQSDEIEFWFSILVMILVMVFSALGKLINAKKEEKQSRDVQKGGFQQARDEYKPWKRSAETPQDHPAGTHRYSQRQARPAKKPRPKKQASSTPPRQGRYSRRPPAASLISPSDLTGTYRSQPTGTRGVEQHDLAEKMQAGIDSEPEQNQIEIGEEPVADVLKASGLKLDSTKQLRQAILYSEIIGKPVGLRQE